MLIIIKQINARIEQLNREIEQAVTNKSYAVASQNELIIVGLHMSKKYLIEDISEKENITVKEAEGKYWNLKFT